MWRRKQIAPVGGPEVYVEIAKGALLEVFDECDRYDVDETGGRILGTFEEANGKLTLRISGVIEPGPNARRSPTSFFQDGEHQERVFRKIEKSHPQIEHLGNWHTHHVNGLRTLSGGDLDTYRRIVNHPKQNTPFFYVFLVIEKHRARRDKDRYSVKHFLFRPSDDRVYEIPASHVKLVEEPLVWPVTCDPPLKSSANHSAPTAVAGRVSDRDVLGEYFPAVRPYSSAKLGIYWRGPITLADDSHVEVVVVEDADQETPKYSVTLRKPARALASVVETLAAQEFSSARAALITAERACNRAIFQHRA